ncbi:MAG: NUDIX hydrolase [Planctomycetota bacterium]
MPYEYEFPRPAVSVDLLVRRTIEEVDHVLLVQRRDAPFAGCWALPGGFMNMDETLEQAAQRELEEETGLAANSLRQLHTFSALGRDPRGRTISTTFEAFVDATATPEADDDAMDVSWFPVSDLPELAFDHSAILCHLLSRTNDVRPLN